MYEVIINKEEKELLVKLSEKLLLKNNNLVYAKELSKLLPNRIKNKLDEFINNKNPVIIMKNLPIEKDIPQTPINNTFHIGETTMLARIQTIINEYIGEMVSYEAEGGGLLFQDMVPNKKLSNTQTSLGSRVELELHTEQAFSELRPDYLCLACLRGNNGAKTYYLDIKNITQRMSIEELNMLKNKLWNIGVDLSFTMNGCNGEIRGPLSILNSKNGHLELVFDQDLIIGLTDEANKLTQKIIDIYYEDREHVILQSGDILIINNHRSVHGRSSFTPNYDGYDRFIIRSFIMSNKNKIKDKTGKNERMVLKQFS